VAAYESKLENFRVPVTGTGDCSIGWFCKPGSDEDIIEIKCYPDGTGLYPGFRSDQMKVGFHKQVSGLKIVSHFSNGTNLGDYKLIDSRTPITWRALTIGQHLQFAKETGSRNVYYFNRAKFWQFFGGKWLLFDWVKD
jgi:hypothetical protein